MQEALAAVPGVRKVDVDFDKKQAVVRVEKGKLDRQALLKSLEDAGFGGAIAG